MRRLLIVAVTAFLMGYALALLRAPVIVRAQQPEPLFTLFPTLKGDGIYIRRPLEDIMAIGPAMADKTDPILPYYRPIYLRGGVGPFYVTEQSLGLTR